MKAQDSMVRVTQLVARERQRRKDLEENRKAEESAAQRKQAEFDRQLVHRSLQSADQLFMEPFLKARAFAEPVSGPCFVFEVPGYRPILGVMMGNATRWFHKDADGLHREGSLQEVLLESEEE